MERRWLVAERWITVSGELDDLQGFIDLVEKRFGVLPTSDLEVGVTYADNSDSMAHAFSLGLAMYIQGFVDGHVDFTMEIADEGWLDK